jgi:endonuclease/exonuclease/phosphatase family metal-dependent hydrolase
MVRVATWNLWWRYGDWSARARAIRSELRSLQADVIGLQEVWATADENFAEDLGKDLGFKCAFVASPKPEKWQAKLGDSSVTIGNAILSRWPITESVSVRLPAGGGADEGRTGLFARVAAPGGDLPFFTAHLNSGWAQSTIRTQQLASMGQFMLEQTPGAFPPILCGDFNADADFDEIRALSGKRDALVPGLALMDAWWLLNPREPGWTWDRRNPHVAATGEPSCRIDYVFTGFVTAGRPGRPVSAGVFGDQSRDGVWPSDHFGVWVELANAA